MGFSIPVCIAPGVRAFAGDGYAGGASPAEVLCSKVHLSPLWQDPLLANEKHSPLTGVLPWSLISFISETRVSVMLVFGSSLVLPPLSSALPGEE